MIKKFIIGALAVAFLGGAVLLFKQTVRGMQCTAPKPVVIICAAIYALIGLPFVVMGIMYASVLGSYIFFGLVFLGLSFALIWKNFIKKTPPEE